MAGDWKRKQKRIFFCILIVIFFFFLTDQYCYDSVYRKRANKITAGQKGSSSSSGRYRLFCNQYNKTFMYKLYNAIVLNSGLCLSSESIVVLQPFFSYLLITIRFIEYIFPRLLIIPKYII